MLDNEETILRSKSISEDERQSGAESLGHGWESIDTLLGTFVRLIEAKGGSFQATLNIGGMLVSGEVVGTKAYFEAQGNEFDRALAARNDPSGAAGWKQFFERLAHEASAVSLEEEVTGTVHLRAPKYVHIRNARFWHPHSNLPIPTEGVWWRGRMDAVLGFVFGKMTARLA